MKIFMLIKWLHYSGAPKMFLWLSKALANQGHDITIFNYIKGDDISIPDGIHYEYYNLENVNFISKISHIRRLIRINDYDICISFLLDANVYNIISCLGLKTKSIVCERNDPFKPKYYKLKLWKPLFRFADGAVFQLPKVAKFYSNIKVSTAIIPNPVLCKSNIEIKPFSERKKEIVSLGRIDLFQKRQDILIKAFAIFHKFHPDYQLSIYGNGEESDMKKIVNLITSLGLIRDVKLCGITLNPQQSIKDSKIFVLTSDFEGIPNALIEAMSLGLPCISTDCRPGGAAFLIENMVNGLIVSKGNEQMLADKLHFLVSNPELADSIGYMARNISFKFSEDRIIEMWNGYIKSL